MSFAGRTKVYFVEGIDASVNGIAAAQALSLGADGDALALDQAVDVAADTNAIALAQTYADTVALTLEAAAASLIPPRNVTLTADSDESGTTFTIVGVDENGDPATEPLVGPNNTTVTSVNVYSSVTSITPDQTEAVDEIEAGWAANTVPYQLTLNGTLGNGLANVSDVFAAAPVTIESGENLSGITFTITGLGTNGLPLVEVVTGPNNATVTTVNVFTRVDSIVPSDDSGAGASTATAGIGAAVAQGGMTLEAAAADLDPARRLSFDASGDISAIVFTITGTDRWGNPIVETLTGVTTTPVETKAAFASVTLIEFSAATTETVTVGWVVGGQTPWVLCGRGFGHDQKPECAISVLATAGAADGEVETTFDEFPDLDETEIDADKTTAITPGTPVFEKGEGVRFVLTTGAGTTAKVKFTRAGP